MEDNLKTALAECLDIEKFIRLSVRAFLQDMAADPKYLAITFEEFESFKQEMTDKELANLIHNGE